MGEDQSAFVKHTLPADVGRLRNSARTNGYYEFGLECGGHIVPVSQ